VDEICAIRSSWRHGDNLIELATIHLQHMQKALDQMNVQLHHVISDLAGTTGLAIIDAILTGERDPRKPAQLPYWRIRASKETIIKSLAGDSAKSIYSRYANRWSRTGITKTLFRRSILG
jgi:transposase